MRVRSGSLATLAVAALLLACGGTEPRPVVLGEDTCAHCRMEVTDARFATEAVTRTGRVNVFDSIDCLSSYVKGAEAGSIAAVWVTDFENPGTFVEAAKAGYLVGSSIQGPMGSTVAFASLDAARLAQPRFGGTVKEWSSLLGHAVEAVASAQ